MTRVRDPLLLTGTLLALGVLLVGIFESKDWIGRPFPGFLVLANGVVPSAGLARWPATEGGEIYQYELLKIDSRLNGEPGQVYEAVSQLPIGTTLRYEMRAERTLTRDIQTRRFDGIDYTFLFGAYLFCGTALVGTGLGLRYLRRRSPVASGTGLALWIIGMYALTAVDLYGPYRLFRLHVALECLLFAATLHIALMFPQPRLAEKSAKRSLCAVYALGLAFGAVAQLGVFEPPLYVAIHRAAMLLWAVSLVVLIGAQLSAFFRPPDFEARQRVKVLALGTLLALLPQVFLTLSGAASENLVAFSGVLFPASLGYAVLRHNLLDVDVFVRRTLNYALMTGFVTLTYLGAIRSFEAIFSDTASAGTGAFGFVVPVLCVIVLLPLRDRFQTLVDRLFFRTAYDFRRIVETASERLASVADLTVISEEISRAVGDTLHPKSLVLFVRRGEQDLLLPYAARPAEAADAERWLPGAMEAHAPMDVGEGELCVPFRADNELIAMLVLGRPLSGRMYGGDDRSLLQTLANQGAVAIENALALEQLRDLNRNLEDKVEARTRELRQAQAQLVHREKMASIGQFVAGIAHELNNPLHFIQGNLFFLREHMDTLGEVIEAYESAAIAKDEQFRTLFDAIRDKHDLDDLFSEVDSIFEGCTEGAERSASLVDDLRTFSRLDQPESMEVDLHEAIDSALNMLRSKLTTIAVEKDYGDIPKVDCLAGQMSQVFMNLIANAADAIGERGTIQIRTALLGNDRVVVEIEDDGSGIEPDNLKRIFDPFFTTKAVGEGTGLGLAISHGIVTQQGGVISAESEPGRYTRFRIELPISIGTVESPNHP